MATAFTTDGSQAQAPTTSIAAVSRHDGMIAIGPVLPEDIGALFLWLNDCEAAKADTPFRPVDAAMFKTWLERATQPSGDCVFAIRTLSAPAAIGYVQLRNVHPVNRSAELGVRIGRECDRGKGVGTRAVKLITAYAFETLNLNRVYLTVAASNARAIAAYMRAGFQNEGIQRQASFLDGKWVDILMMSVLRSDAIGSGSATLHAVAGQVP